MDPTEEEKVRAAEEHLTLLQTLLISLGDARPCKPDDEYDAKKADIERQIAEIEQDLLYHQEMLEGEVGGAAAPSKRAASESRGGGTLSKSRRRIGDEVRACVCVCRFHRGSCFLCYPHSHTLSCFPDSGLESPRRWQRCWGRCRCRPAQAC
jgi:hypothetical protein